MGRTTLVEHDVPVEMRDGTVLRADVWRPAEGPPAPAVLFRTPYGKSPLGLATLTPAQCVDRGYAAVVQDTRGRFASEGEWAPLDWSQEGPDGYDTVEWTAGQPWCDGNVAMAGTSYQAIVQWLAAMEKPPHLRAIAWRMSTSAPFDAEQLGGALRLDHLTSWLGLTALEWVQRRAAAGDPVDGAVVAEVVQLLTTPEVPLRRWPLSTILDFEGFPGLSCGTSSRGRWRRWPTTASARSACPRSRWAAGTTCSPTARSSCTGRCAPRTRWPGGTNWSSGPGSTPANCRRCRAR